MKKCIAYFLCLSLMACALGGFGRAALAEEPKLRVVTTVFFEYDWVREILGEDADNVELTMLMDSGVDLHSYQPTADDILKIATCDLFIYVGGESDEWAHDVLEKVASPDMKALNLLDALGDLAKAEELVEGMQDDEHEGEDDEDEEHGEYDEHIWLSLKNAVVLCRVIADELAAMNPPRGDEYSANADAYIEKLAALDARYQAAVDMAPVKTMLFGDRFPFRYMADDYGLAYYAAFVGCSAETEASFETIAFLSTKVDELGLTNVLTLEGAGHRIAETIIANTRTKDQHVVALDSMQSITSGDVQSGATYLSIMEKNLGALTAALQ